MAEPLEILCDAPPYAVVKACRTLGFVEPEDVRWCRASKSQPAAPSGLAKLLPRSAGSLLGKLFTGSQAQCACGRPRPLLERYTFTFRSGRAATYLLAQCPGCRAMFWEETR